MASTRQCPKCGLDLSDRPDLACPACGTKTIALPGAKIWWAALLQFALSTIFMLVFGFPRIMIAIFGAVILLGTALSSQAKARQVTAARAPQPAVTHPAMFRVLSLGAAVSGFAVFAILLFGFVAFINPYMRWQQYQGQSYHRADFEVTRVYFQRGSKGGVDAYASGTVDGQKEWMSLLPYLHSAPRSQAELDERVPAGTSIPIYFFPHMKGRLRVEVYSQTPTAELYYHTAMTALKYGLGALAMAGAIFLALLRLRTLCLQNRETQFATATPGLDARFSH